jgi:hypothetical protein
MKQVRSLVKMFVQSAYRPIGFHVHVLAMEKEEYTANSSKNSLNHVENAWEAVHGVDGASTGESAETK